MLKKSSFIIALACSFSFASVSWAYVIGGSNLGILGYQKHTCYKPYKPFDLSSSFEVNSYNLRLETYIACIKNYIENAKNDIERIKEAANEAISEANAP